ncbi:MAG: hypothetical protein RL653_2048 [Pseudomonadota bacterium]
MYLVVPLMLLGVAGAFASVRALLAATLGVAALTALTAGARDGLALQSVEQAIAHVRPDDQALMRKQGREEASNILYLGALATALPLLVGGFTTAAGLSRRETA